MGCGASGRAGLAPEEDRLAQASVLEVASRQRAMGSPHASGRGLGEKTEHAVTTSAGSCSSESNADLDPSYSASFLKGDELNQNPRRRSAVYDDRLDVEADNPAAICIPPSAIQSTRLDLQHPLPSELVNLLEGPKASREPSKLGAPAPRQPEQVSPDHRRSNGATPEQDLDLYGGTGDGAWNKVAGKAGDDADFPEISETNRAH